VASAETAPGGGAGRTAGRSAEEILLLEKTLADRERERGPDHPRTLVSRSNLAIAYWRAGRLAEAIPLLEKGFAGCERVLDR
jgi:hypothetical protein